MSSTEAKAPQETVLVVEDEILVRFVIAEYLRDCGYRVIEATSADEAIVLLKTPKVRIDVLFTDIDMPGSMNGFALARWTRANRPEIKIELTGSVPQSADVAGDLCENGPLLTKPYEPQAVVDRIRRLLAARR